MTCRVPGADEIVACSLSGHVPRRPPTGRKVDLRVTRARSLLLGLVVILALVLLLAALYAVRTVRRPLPRTTGTVTLEALDAPVDVRRDAFGIPHVYADTAHDLFVAQGYVHAQDRFWEMDVRRHTTAGRLSELFGPDQVETDVFLRTMGWRRVAEQELDMLAPATVAMLEAYAEGVNAYLDGRRPGDIALEYSVLGLQRPGYTPEPWTPADSVAWLKAMAFDLRGNTDDERARVEYTETLPAERVEQLWPPFPYDLRDPIVDAAAAAATPADDPLAAGPARPHAAVAAGRDRVTAVDERMAALPQMLGPAGSGIGSNSFVLSGERTATGRPLLANDPHLAPSLPSIWYQMALHCRQVTDACPYAVTGFSFSGFPGIIIGHNDRIAWGFTNLGPDVADYVLERVDGDRYAYDGEMLALETRREIIRVAGGSDVEITVRSTRHGPLVSDALEPLEGVARRAPAGDDRQELSVALRWTALRPGRTADAVPMLNAATGWEEFRAAASRFEVPAQNMAYADVDGNIGYQAPGRIPIRAPGDDGRWPVPGWTGRHDWQGFVPFDALPSVRNPPEGLIITANQPVVDDDTGLFLSRDHAYGWRSARLSALLDDARGVEVDDLLAVQMDARNGLTEALVPLLAQVDVPAEVRPARDLLTGWDGQQSADSAPGAYFAAVWRHLLLRTFGDDLPDDARIDGGGRWMEVVRVLADQPDSPWWDDRATATREDRDAMLRSALIAAQRELVDRLGGDVIAWRWADLHTLPLRHETLGSSGVDPIERLFNRGPVGVGGGPSIVHATGWDAWAGYAVDWVPSMRMVVDLSDLDASRWVNLTGASGHAFSPHYVDQVSRWQSGATVPMRWSEPAVRAATTDHLVLDDGSAGPDT
jgi:penicillin amidase